MGVRGIESRFFRAGGLHSGLDSMHMFRYCGLRRFHFFYPDIHKQLSSLTPHPHSHPLNPEIQSPIQAQACGSIVSPLVRLGLQCFCLYLLTRLLTPKCFILPPPILTQPTSPQRRNHKRNMRRSEKAEKVKKKKGGGVRRTGMSGKKNAMYLLHHMNELLDTDINTAKKLLLW